MRVLFLHNNFPAQYRYVATALAADPANQVVFGTQNPEGSLPNVRKMMHKASRTPHASTHHYVRNYEEAVLNGQAVFRAGLELKRSGFEPDIVCGHSGWGPTLFVKDLWPRTKLLPYFEWFYRARGSDADFLEPNSITEDDACRIRARNAPILTDLAQCEAGICPTEFQRSQFPDLFKQKLIRLFDGIDTNFFTPEPTEKLVLPEQNLDLSEVGEIVTYATRGMEPYRGFPQFMRAAAILHERRPNLHVVVTGTDRVAYGRQLPKGQTWKQTMLAELEGRLDLSRLHFTGSLPYGKYRQVLRASSAHVYMTVPFVLSWSLMESLASGCLVIASDTAPIHEVIQEGVTGLLADFFSPEKVADRVEEALDDRPRMAKIRANAREFVMQNYALSKLLPQHINLIRDVAAVRA